MKSKCRYCNRKAEYLVDGNFCSHSCKILYFNKAKRELKRLQREFYRKYRI